MFHNLRTLKTIVFFSCTLALNFSFSQVVFSETFNEANTSTSGVDNVGGVAWTSSCPTCLSGDYWHVNGGGFECNDSNGSAVWSTSSINISSCGSIEVTFDVSEVGTLEACGTGCNSADWLSFQYNIDGGGWQDPANSFFCAGACAGVNVIFADDIASGTANYASGCITGGSNLQIRIACQNWAGTEFWKIDNVTVSCACVTLPIQMSYFEAEALPSNSVELTWQTVTESNNESFAIQRSLNNMNWETLATVDGAGNSTQPINYRAYDNSPYSGTSYYRIEQRDFNGTTYFSPSESIVFEKSQPSLLVFPNPFESTVSIEIPSSMTFPLQVLVEDCMGRVVYSETQFTPAQKVQVPLNATLKPGTYFIRVANDEVQFTEKLTKLIKL